MALHRPDRSPSQRFRFEQFVPFLKENGWVCDYAYVLDEAGDKAFYTAGAYLKKSAIVVRGFIKRLAHLQAARHYDVIFIQRETFLSGTTFFERQLAKMKAKVVFDFDDAIWLLDVSEANKNLKWLKRPEKTAKIISVADLVLAGNSFLASYAMQFNQNVKTLPTVIDTERYFPVDQSRESERVVIGWTGSQTTNKHFALVAPALKRLQQRFDRQIAFSVISERPVHIDGLDLNFTPWQKEREVHNLNAIDIGIMPLPDDDWSRGKCGFKGIQYMSLAKPTVMSPVGVNVEIISHGENGFLAGNMSDWELILAKLIVDKNLREKIGRAGRKTIEGKYSVEAVKRALLDALDQLVR